MVREHSDFEHVEALPLSTRDTDGLLNGDNSGRIRTFDVEFDVEDDVFLDWQKHGSQSSRCNCCSWCVKCLPERFQEPPDWWWRLSKTQRNLIRYGAITLSGLLLALSILGIVYTVDHSSSHSRLSSSDSSTAAGAASHQAQHMSADSSPICSWDNLYLPKTIQPSHYKLHIKTDMREPYLVEGEVQITLVAAEATPCLVLHANELDVQSVKLLVFGSEDQEPAEVPGSIRTVIDQYQQLILQFPEAVPQSPLQPVLVLTFTYSLKEGLDGFYRSSFVDANNETKVMASTQFESIAARKAFPGFDEPAFKATFDIKITAPSEPLVVLSNMPLSHTHEGRKLHEGEDHDGEDELIGYHFVPTPPMSTYLVAWVIGELAHVEMECPLTLSAPDTPWSKHAHHDGDGDDDDDDDSDHPDVDDGARGRHLPVKVWGTTDRASQFGHAKEAACHALQTMEQLLQVPYSLPKLDLVAIPNFAAGAMENWGLLTYRETALLVDDAVDDIKQRYSIATTVAHETAHQWFGDLVTLDDWTELWLNEGFATYFEVVVADAFKPDWGYFDAFLQSTTSPGLEADGITTSHPLSIAQPPKQLSEIDNWFDDVSYSKGAAVLRMLRAWLNRGNAPMLGFSSSVNPNNTVVDNSQHMRRLLNRQEQRVERALVQQQQQQRGPQPERQRPSRRLQQLLSQYLDDSIGFGSSTAAGANWWSGRTHVGQSTKLPDVAEPNEQQQKLLEQEAELEQGQVPYDGDYPEPSDDAEPPASDAAAVNTDNTGSSSSSDDWWTKRSHFGAATANLQQQAQPAADDGSSSSSTPAVIAAPAGAAFLTSDKGPHSDNSSDTSTDNSNSKVTDVMDSRSNDDVTASTEGATGQDVFLLGLRSYLQDLSYKNSNYSTLWEHLEKVSGQPVTQMMNTWTLRRGFPIVSVSLQPKAGAPQNQQLVHFDQLPYHAPRTYMVGLPFYPEMYCNDWTENPQDDSWWIPLAIKTPGSNSVEWHSFSNCSSNITMAVPHNGWVLANAGRYGFYRVNYSEPLWNALAAAAADRNQVSGVDFAGLLDDAYSLSLVRQLNITVFLSLTKALGARFAPELAPWSMALGWLLRMSDILSTAAYGPDGGRWKDCLAHLNSYVTDELTKPFIAKVEIPGAAQPGLDFQVNSEDSPELRQLRPQVLTSAGFLGDQDVMSQAVALLKDVAAGKATLSPDVTKAVYSLAVGSGDSVAYDVVKKIYEQANDPADEQRALSALARATTGPMITKTLEYALSSTVRTQDVSSLLVGLAKQGGLGFNMTWEFILTRADDVLNKYGGGDLTYTLGRRLNRLAKLFVDEQMLDRVKAFAEKQPKILSPTFLDEANEARMINADWLRFQGVDACAWLASSSARSSSGGR